MHIRQGVVREMSKKALSIQHFPVWLPEAENKGNIKKKYKACLLTYKI